ncbi:MAG: rod shape-determining protein RodA [Candidatus Omnitrophica bacterium]|nr:rod shape-determining protein RodA [Candidatus Omnitrophota bacterium]
MTSSTRIQTLSWDRALIAAAGVLCLISIVALASACATLNPSLTMKQAMWIGLGVLISLAAASGPYTRWLDMSLFLYAGALALLAVVAVAGTVKLGAARWLTIFGFSLQPSELAKLATACVVARYLAAQPTPLSVRTLFLSGALAGVPALLVFLQPDLGSSSIFVAIWLGMVIVAGMSRRHVLMLIAAGTALCPLAWHGLKDYQRLRLLVFLDPHLDPLGAGYTIIQSQIAIGSGRLLGRGWFAGTQNQLNFLPERHADFLYSVIGEEWGFAGSVFVVVLFGVLVWRASRIGSLTPDPQGRLLAAGVVSWLGYQAVINMGMVMGLLPVVGVPLPLVSYGGSAMVAAWTALGLVQSIHRFGTRL